MKAPGVLRSTTIKTKRRLMYYIGAFNFMYVYTILAYSMAVFLIERFPENPNAIFFVGVILALANFCGLFMNGIWLYMQKTVAPKTLLSISVIGLIISVSIFLISQTFFSILALPAFTLLAAFCYVWSFDVYDITMTTLILKSIKEETQSQEFSQKKIAESIGMLMGIITGGVFLYIGTIVTQFFLLVFLFSLYIYIKKNFENEKDDVELVFSQESGVEWKEVLQVLSNPDKVKTKIRKANGTLQQKVVRISHAVSSEIGKEIKSLPTTTSDSIAKVSKKTKSLVNEARLLLLDILAKENEVQRKTVPKHNFHFREILSEITSSFSLLASALSFNTRYAFFWATMMVMFFSFWDTMAVTYQPIFLEKYKDTLGVFTAMIMPLFILPIFILQIPFGKLSDKWGNHVMMMAGLCMSAVSLIILGTLDDLWGGSVWILILSGMGNSIGYAAAFSSSQLKFTNEVKYFLKTQKQKQENRTMAATLRLTLNIGNILGQLFGGIIFAVLGFLYGFLFLGFFLLFLFMLSLFFMPYLALPKKR